MFCTVRSTFAAITSLPLLRALPLLWMTVYGAPLLAQPFVATDLGTLSPGGTNTPYDINLLHQVVGASLPNTTAPFNTGYSWTSSGGIVALPTSGNIRPYEGMAINAGGQIAGTAEIGTRIEAYRLTGTTITLLGTLSPLLESTGRGINVHGDVVGSCIDRNFVLPSFGFIHRAGVMSQAGTLREALDINDSGFVVGVGGSPQAPMMWDSNINVSTNLGTLGGSPFASYAVAINNSNQVVGWSNTSSGVTHAYVWTSATGMVDLNASSGTNASFANDINNSGEIVGSMGSTAGMRAFYWSNGVTIDLNTWLPASSGWVLERANAISDTGCIVGTGLLNGQPRGFIMCIPEPATASLAALTLLAVTRLRTTRARRTHH